MKGGKDEKGRKEIQREKINLRCSDGSLPFLY